MTEMTPTAPLAREGVSDDRNDTHSAQRDEREGDAVIARNDVEVGWFVLDDVIHLRDVARSLLDGNHVLEVAGNAQGGFGRHVHTCTAGHVVEHDRQFRSFGNGLVVLVDTLLRRFIIVRYYGEDGVHTGEIVVFQRIDDGAGVVSAHSQ